MARATLMGHCLSNTPPKKGIKTKKGEREAPSSDGPNQGKDHPRFSYLAEWLASQTIWNLQAAESS